MCPGPFYGREGAKCQFRETSGGSVVWNVVEGPLQPGDKLLPSPHPTTRHAWAYTGVLHLRERRPPDTRMSGPEARELGIW